MVADIPANTIVGQAERVRMGMGSMEIDYLDLKVMSAARW